MANLGVHFTPGSFDSRLSCLLICIDTCACSSSSVAAPKPGFEHEGTLCTAPLARGKRVSMTYCRAIEEAVLVTCELRGRYSCSRISRRSLPCGYWREATVASGVAYYSANRPLTMLSGPASLQSRAGSGSTRTASLCGKPLLANTDVFRANHAAPAMLGRFLRSQARLKQSRSALQAVHAVRNQFLGASAVDAFAATGPAASSLPHNSGAAVGHQQLRTRTKMAAKNKGRGDQPQSSNGAHPDPDAAAKEAALAMVMKSINDKFGKGSLMTLGDVPQNVSGTQLQGSSFHLWPCC